MNTLVFFPWLRLAGNINIDGIDLLSYRRGSEPFGGTELQKTVDELLATHIERLEQPVSQATLLVMDSADPTRNLTPAEISRAFELKEFLAVSCLATRELFANGGVGYCNSHYFQLVVQSFRTPFQGTSVTTRRRDGTTGSFWGRDTYRVPMPEHVHPMYGVPVRLDKDMLEGLLLARPDERFLCIWEAVLGYNLANTDSREISDYVELVLLSGALERVFDCRRGREDELVENFLTRPVPTNQTDAMSIPKIAAAIARGQFQPGSSVREIWLRDFFRLRNDVAHGRITPGRTPVWSMREHLLLASYVFPFALKAVLQTLRVYTFSDDDQLGFDAFEGLASADLFTPRGHEADPSSWAWNHVMEKVREERFRRAWIDLYDRSPDRGQKPASGDT